MTATSTPPQNLVSAMPDTTRARIGLALDLDAPEQMEFITAKQAVTKLKKSVSS